MKGTSKLPSRHLSADRPLQRLRGCFLGDNAAVPPAYRVKVEKCASFVDILDVCKFTTFCDRKGYTRFRNLLNKRKISRFPAISRRFQLVHAPFRNRHSPGYKGQPEVLNSAHAKYSRLNAHAHAHYTRPAHFCCDIRDFNGDFPDFTKDFRISTEISGFREDFRFHERFQAKCTRSGGPLALLSTYTHAHTAN